MRNKYILLLIVLLALSISLFGSLGAYNPKVRGSNPLPATN
jgi:hypothetical protein